MSENGYVTVEDYRPGSLIRGTSNTSVLTDPYDYKITPQLHPFLKRIHKKSIKHLCMYFQKTHLNKILYLLLGAIDDVLPA